MIDNHKKPIGVYDSGVGGLTVLKELCKHLPGEDIIYFGDTDNCPFGNRGKEELTAITNNIFAFFSTRKVKLTVSACNTTSALFQLEGEPDTDFRVLSIIEPTAKRIATLGIDKIGVIATEFTVNSGIYKRLIRAQNPGIKVWGQGSRHLARLVESSAFGGDELANEVRGVTQALLDRQNLTHIILACTHYPIVREEFENTAPGVIFLDPANAQAQFTRELLEEQNLANPKIAGNLEIYTSGDPRPFEEIARRMGISGITKIEHLKL